MFNNSITPLLISLMVIAVCIVQNVQADNKCTNSTSCSNHGTCGGTDGSKACSCTGGYGGDICDQEPKCSSNSSSSIPQCLNSGNCTETAGKQSICTCMSGYGGDTCKLKDACAKNEDCLHSGSCNGTTTPKKCVCVNGYSGPTCQNAASVEKLSARLLAVVTVSILIKMQFMRDLP